MSFPPIVQRELRAAARRKSTFRVRWWAALIAMVMSLVSLAAVSISRGSGNLGAPVFSLVTWYAFGLCLLAGTVLTADAVSAEKRDGTLGLLFLTNLKGYDVVLGKFFARSLNAFYGLLALLPVIGLPVLLGGVTGAEFWRAALALANALFFSLAAGICISAFMRDSARAMGNTLGLLLLFAVGVPALIDWAAPTRYSAPVSALGWISPFYPFSHAAGFLSSSRARVFWGSLLGSQMAGWALLALASLALPRTWQKPPVVPSRGTRLRNWERRGQSPGGGSLPRRERLSENPVLWLSSGEIGTPWDAWAIALVWGALVATTGLMAPGPKGPSILGGYGAVPFGFLLKVLFAFRACRFFAEGRRTGALELLLCTPLTDREILRGHLMALWRAFRWPLGVFFAFLFAPTGAQITAAIWYRSFADALPSAYDVFAKGFYSARLVADLVALCWFGTGLALTTKKPAFAPALTILFVLVLPAPLCWLDFVADLVLIAWGLGRAQQDLRRLLVQQYQAPVSSPPPPPIAAPPLVLG
jgi:ABC-type transport system involved in multi-copper enzyme maturation permease subunit